MLIEGGLTLISVALAFCWPGIAHSFFSRLERASSRLTRRKSLAVAVVGLSALLLRLALLPLSPIPRPSTPVDFSFLLAANTFASGRLSNPTPALWQHFESFHISMQPTYMSMYFPAQGLVLAVGKLLFGNPWFGNLLVTSLMCAALCWMLQAWLPPSWALLGGLLAILRLGLFSYWIDSYSGGGSLAALAGALVLGALPRLLRSASLRHSLLLAAGVALLLLSRPYEGLLLCLPVAFLLLRRFLAAAPRPSAALLFRRTALPLTLVLAAGAWMAFYDRQVFGNPLTLPYTVNRATYAMAPYYVWQSARPEPPYRHAVMRDFYYRHELADFEKIHSRSGFLPRTLLKPVVALVFYAGIALLPPLLMLRRVLLDRRTRFLVLSVLVLAAGMSSEIFLIPHYLAAFTCAFYALGLQAMRHLRVWNPGQRPGQKPVGLAPVGLAIVRLTVTVCVVLAGVRAFAAPLHLDLPVWPSTSQWTWYGTGISGLPRARTESLLEALPGRQLVFVRYAPTHDSWDEWVYNAPDLDNSRVIWAREMDPASDLQLIRFYKDRTVWLVQPDLRPAGLALYSLPAQPLSSSVASGLHTPQHATEVKP